jgi:tetratricopeptide (TPR) repeat protein
MLFAINAENLLLETARRVDEWTLIEKKIPSFDVVFAADPERANASDATLTPEQTQLLPLLDGTRSLRALIDATGLMEFEVGHAVFGLVQAGFAREVGHSAQAPGGGEPDPFEVRSLANAFYRAGMFEDAEREYHRLLERRPDDEPARLRLAAIALRDGRPHDALAELESLLQVHGPRYAALLNLATVLRLQNRNEDALIALNQAEALRPACAAVPLERGVLALRARRVADARRELDESRRRLGPDAVPAPRWYYHAALAAALAGQSEAAGTLAREGVAAHPESPPLLLMAGLLAERDGDLDAAERAYAQVAELDPGIVQVHKNLGDIAFRRGAHEQALALYQRAVEKAPDLGDDVYAKLGTLYYRGRNRDGAIRCWRRSLELNPDNELVRNNLDIVARAGA